MIWFLALIVAVLVIASLINLVGKAPQNDG